MILEEFISTNKNLLFIVPMILAMVFIMIGHVYRDQVQLLLKREFMKFPECSLDWWSVSHFLLYCYFGFLFPGEPLKWFLMGVGFELFEDYLSSNKETQLCDCSGGKSFWCNGLENDYWYMNPSDPWVN